MEGEEGRRSLNPNAPPFYPTRFHKFRADHRPPPPRNINIRRRCNSLITPVPSGPRIGRSSWVPRRRPIDVEPAAVNVVEADHKTSLREIIPLKPGDHATSVMIRNIPNNYTRHLLVEFLENHCKHENEKQDDEENSTIPSAFDFVYLPVDFRHGLNAGYAFVNFTSPEAAWKFHTCVKGKRWDLFQSKKIADVTRAKIQGKEALVKNCERMKLCSPSSDYLPVWFDPPRDGCSSSSTTTENMHVIR